MTTSSRPPRGAATSRAVERSFDGVGSVGEVDDDIEGLARVHRLEPARRSRGARKRAQGRIACEVEAVGKREGRDRITRVVGPRQPGLELEPPARSVDSDVSVAQRPRTAANPVIGLRPATEREDAAPAVANLVREPATERVFAVHDRQRDGAVSRTNSRRFAAA